MKILLIFLLISAIFIPSYESINFENDEMIQVSIEGEVIQNGIIEVEKFSTLNDVLKNLSLTKDADLRALSRFTILKDGDTIVIPKYEEVKKVSINFSTKEELMTLPGIGPSTAERIIAYRSENGLFQFIEDVRFVKGIGEAKFNKIKDKICL